MKYAYVSTQEIVNNYDGTSGVRVVQVQDTKDGLIDDMPNLFWVECSDEMTGDNSYYDVIDHQVKLIPVKPIIQPVTTAQVF